MFVDPERVDTNIVVFEVVRSERSTPELLQACKDAGVLLNAMGERVFRAVTHLDVDGADIEKAAHVLSSVLAV